MKTDNPDEPWFLAMDVCKILDLQTRDVTKRLDSDEMSYVDRNHLGLRPGKPMIILNEPGLYSTILQSRVPAAKEFKRWVTHEVLPSIRKHGAYMSPAKLVELIQNPDSITTLLETLRDEQIKNVSA